MKKIIILVLVIALTLTAFAGCGNNKELEETKAKLAETQKILDNSKVFPQDPFTSVSKPQAKYDLGVTPQELVDMGTNFKGTYLLATVNPNATANVGYIIYSVTKVGDKFFVTQPSYHQTGMNLFREKGGVAIWVDQFNSKGSITDPAVNKTGYTTRGIKMTLKLSDDKAVAEELKLKDGTYAYEIVSTVPLG